MEEKDQNYEFMTETIKKPPVNKRKLFKKIVTTIFLGILFGLCACAAFAFAFPHIQAYLYPPDETKPVSLPVDESVQEEEPVEPFVMPENDSSAEAPDNDKAQGPEDGEKKPEDEAASTPAPDNPEKSDEAEKEVVVNNIVETIEKDLELDDYRSLLRKISAIADATKKSLVTVSAVSSNTDWFNNSYENNNSTTGIIIADNGRELLMISPSDILNKARNVRVTFCDGMTYPARVKDADANTDLCIVSIDLEHIEEKTMEQIEMAQFGGIATSAVGVPVVAVGAPYGAPGSVGTGQITSNSVVIDKSDSSVRIISTDIYASVDGSGVLVNYNGRIVGIICHEDMSGNMPNLLRAYAVSDISDSIEKISNGQQLATLGIIGTDVTPEANADRNVPFGAYVKEVVADSPAMNVGIRNGDVIVKLGTTEISSFADYRQAMLGYQPQDVVTVTLERPGRDEYAEMTYEVTLEELK
ncbi:MAG: PDZ domain-containing protein [Lachnospiraceae bacterium]|nr:PDZ domain-containing protein [Lachnospiraceae bacterium]